MGDIGFTRMPVGFGNRTIPGVGLHFTMGDGNCIPAVVGFGRQTQSGVLHGWSGVIMAITAVGRLYRPAPSLKWGSVGALMAFTWDSTSISVFMPIISPLLASMISTSA